MKSFWLCDIHSINIIILTTESVLGTCITSLTDSNTTEKWWHWPDTDTDIRIGATLLSLILCGDDKVAISSQQ